MMPFMNWSEEYSVGNEELDTHHKHLFALLEEVSSLLTETDIESKLDSILSQLKTYTVFHFEAEESKMSASNYPHYTEHKAIHDDFIAKISALTDQKSSSSFDSLDDLFLFLNQWLVTHIQIEDKKYMNHI